VPVLATDQVNGIVVPEVAVVGDAVIFATRSGLTICRISETPWLLLSPTEVSIKLLLASVTTIRR
jgi:hypothetical protein